MWEKLQTFFSKIFSQGKARQDIEIELLRADIDTIRRILEQARVANFIKIITYEPGMDLMYRPPKPISLEDLERRIEKLEISRALEMLQQQDDTP